MRILHLTLKKKWFDMIASGEKKEEYREIKPYWANRLAEKHLGAMGGDFMDKHKVVAYTFKEFDVVRFRNGYASDAPTVDVECRYIRTSIGMPKWGAVPGERYFVIKLGKVLFNSDKNDERTASQQKNNQGTTA